MTTYAAHIIAAYGGLGDPAVIIMGNDGDYVAELPLTSGQTPAEALESAGWRTVGETTEAATGYTIVDVEPVDPVALVAAVTYARAQAQAELDRQDTAWRAVIRDAMLDESTSKTAIAQAGGISRERAYQIRDGRR